jgi:hypothetical protein
VIVTASQVDVERSGYHVPGSLACEASAVQISRAAMSALSPPPPLAPKFPLTVLFETKIVRASLEFLKAGDRAGCCAKAAGAVVKRGITAKSAAVSRRARLLRIRFA